MTATETAPTRGPRCSDWARAEGLDPVATAGSYAGFLLVEWPLPWPRDAADVPGLSSLAAATRERGYRLQLVTAASDERERRAPARSGLRLVAAFSWDGRRFDGRERTVTPAEVARAGETLLSQPADARPVSSRDVLVCGHGRRDRCCGSLGTSLAAAYGARGDGGSDGRLRLWRTSHTGGHRFAPTALLLPEGTLWAFLDEELLDGIVNHRLGAVEAAAHYRGCAGLPTREAQAVERSVLSAMGWPMFDASRSSEQSPGGQVTLRVANDGERRVFEGVVEVRRRLPVPDCGEPLSEAKKSEEELAVVSFTERAEGPAYPGAGGSGR